MPDPTAEQADILAFEKNETANYMVNALAGTGKTSTLEMIQAASKTKPILCIAFNRRAADEMEKRFSDSTTVRTFNGLGHRIWSKTVSKIKVDPKKSADIFRDYANALKGQDRKDTWEVYWQVIQAVSLAKSLGYVPEGKYPHANRLISKEDFCRHLEEKPTPLTLELLDLILLKSIKASYDGWIDYNDQIYMPALFGGTFPRFPLVLIDEGQDLNPVNHAMLSKLVKGRLGIVGDRWQSIYAFRGAVTAGMQVLQEQFACQEFDLSISFRCPEAVVRAAQWRVPNLKAFKAGGRVETLTRLNASAIAEGSTIICRNNAPLFRTAMSLLMQGRSVQVSGSEIGPKLIRLLQKICDDNDTQPIMLGKIEDWKEEKLATSQAPSSIHDTAECLKIFASFGKTLTQAAAYVEHMFKQQGTIKLLTGHKSKGSEWNTVYHLDPWLCSDEEQDQNLKYVVITRSANEYFEIDSRNIRWA